MVLILNTDLIKLDITVIDWQEGERLCVMEEGRVLKGNKILSLQVESH